MHHILTIIQSNEMSEKFEVYQQQCIHFETNVFRYSSGFVRQTSSKALFVADFGLNSDICASVVFALSTAAPLRLRI